MEEKKFFICPACKERSFVKLKKEFDGFKVIGKKKTCALCGYEFKAEEEINYLVEKPLFANDGGPQNFCRDCQSYVQHPWTQKCTRHDKEVTALDSCEQFEQKIIDEE